jgi:hypothetical protein
MPNVYPKQYQSYTAEEIFKVLHLRDSPSLSFRHNGIRGCIQESHVTVDEILSVPGFKESKWIYIRETYEWIPIFKFNEKAEQPPVTTFVDIEPYDDIYQLEGGAFWWATPKGFPRQQHE